MSTQDFWEQPDGHVLDLDNVTNAQRYLRSPDCSPAAKAVIRSLLETIYATRDSRRLRALEASRREYACCEEG